MMNEHDGIHRADGSSSEDDVVRDLLRRAGRRPPIPVEDAARVKAAARDEWRRVVRRTRRRRWTLRSAAALAAAAALVLVLDPRLVERFGASQEAAVGVVESVAGTLEVSALEGSRRAISPGSEIERGSVLETGEGLPSGAVLRLASGYSLRLDRGSRLRLDGEATVHLDRGALYVDSQSVAPGGDAIVVTTPSGSVRDIGTRFAVRVGRDLAPLTVVVRDGAIVLEHEGAEHLARAGAELKLDGQGEVHLSPAPTFGEAWLWVEALLPAYEIEGRSLLDFLHWAARESGRTLRVADPELETRLSQVTLHGSIAGLGLDEALDLALLGSGLPLTHRTESGTLVIEPGEAPPE